MVLGGSLFLLVALATTPKAGTGAPPPPPPLPWLVDAYIGYEPMTGFEPEERGDKWYHQNALQIRGDQVYLHQSPVFCRNGELFSSESDGGFFSFQGEFDKSKAHLTLHYVSCDYCVENKRSAGQRAPRTLAFERLSANRVRLGGLHYSKSTSPNSNACPAK